METQAVPEFPAPVDVPNIQLGGGSLLSERNPETSYSTPIHNIENYQRG